MLRLSNSSQCPWKELPSSGITLWMHMFSVIETSCIQPLSNNMSSILNLNFLFKSYKTRCKDLISLSQTSWLSGKKSWPRLSTYLQNQASWSAIKSCIPPLVNKLKDMGIRDFKDLYHFGVQVESDLDLNTHRWLLRL